MSTGVERAETWRDESADHVAAAEQGAESPAIFDQEYFDASEDPPESASGKWLASALILLALVWIGANALTLSRKWPGPDLEFWTGWVPAFSTPLILLAALWLIAGRTSRRESARFRQSVADLKRETHSLDTMLAVVAERLDQNRAGLSDQAERLMALGDEASDRLGRVAHFLARESAELERKGAALDAAANAARVDIGVLMADLPRVEEQARTAAEAMKMAGLAAHEQSAALEGHLSAVTSLGREADETLGRAAQHLAAHIARIDTSTGAAAQRIGEASTSMETAAEAAMIKASEAIDQLRSSLEMEGRSMLSMVEQGRATLEAASAQASQHLAARLDELSVAIDVFSGRLAAQDEAGQALVTRLSGQIEALGSDLEALGQRGEDQHGRLSASIQALADTARTLHGELAQGDEASSELTRRVGAMSEALTRLGQVMREEIPDALVRLEAQAAETGTAAQAALDPVASMATSATQAAGALDASEASIARQREAIDSLVQQLSEAAALAESQIRNLARATDESSESAARLIQETGPQLVDALVRVREAAGQAAIRAREAISAAIPESAVLLAEASREAVTLAVTEPMQDRLAEIAGASQRAMAIARAASERLTRQLLAIGETAAAIEDRITEDHKRREEQAAENLTRRVSLLIEALNSTAIDVNKILSNEVADTAWTAYLKGDRGVFTRRAVRLLDSGEAREILRHYEEEPDFRDQVNRYVHDFETMLRRVLSDPDGSTLGVTLLSSDMGKLYVALAHAIERIRK